MAGKRRGRLFSVCLSIKVVPQVTENGIWRSEGIGLAGECASIKQTYDLAFLCSKIKEEILLGDDDKISRISVRSLRPIVKEIGWQKQLPLWDGLSHRPCPYCAKSL